MKKIINLIWITILVTIILSLVLLLINAIQGKGNIDFMDNVDIIEKNIQKQQTFENKNFKEINIDAINAKINLYYSNNNEFEIIQYANKKLDKKYLFDISSSSDELVIKEDKNFFKLFSFPFFKTSSVINVYIPQDYKYDIDINAVSKDVIIHENLNLNDVDIDCVSGNVEVKDIIGMDINLKTVSGNIKFKNIDAKEAELKTVSGSINGLKLTANNEIRSTSGYIKIEEIIGNSVVKTVSGSINIMNLTNKITAKTTSGDINIDNFLLKNNSALSSISGKIDLVLSKESNASITTSSVSGKQVLPNKSGEIGTAPFKNLKISTTSGDIYVSVK